jgi:hypothetical protein
MKYFWYLYKERHLDAVPQKHRQEGHMKATEVEIRAKKDKKR